MKQKIMIAVYCDGACSGNPGRGGWAFTTALGPMVSSVSSHEENTTNNRMEVTAAFEALSAIDLWAALNKVNPEDVVTTIYSDSKYPINTMQGGWRINKNVDLWNQIMPYAQKWTPIWKWVKAGSCAEQKACDVNAKSEAQSGISAWHRYDTAANMPD